MKKSVRIAAMIFAIFAILIAVEIIISYKCLTVTDYKIKSDKIKETIKIVLISDLHNSQFGSKNKRLVDKIQKQDPDLILMDGDMLNEDGKNAQIAVELISALKKQHLYITHWGIMRLRIDSAGIRIYIRSYRKQVRRL